MNMKEQSQESQSSDRIETEKKCERQQKRTSAATLTAKGMRRKACLNKQVNY